MPLPADIIAEDSWVLDVQSSDAELILRVEAALRPTHPHFSWPPRRGEILAYATMLVRLSGVVEWAHGPRPPTARDASGELDFGDLSGWTTDEDGTERLDGDWGRVTVTAATQQVDWLLTGD